MDRCRQCGGTTEENPGNPVIDGMCQACRAEPLERVETPETIRVVDFNMLIVVDEVHWDAENVMVTYNDQPGHTAVVRADQVVTYRKVV